MKSGRTREEKMNEHELELNNLEEKIAATEKEQSNLSAQEERVNLSSKKLQRMKDRREDLIKRVIPNCKCDRPHGGFRKTTNKGAYLAATGLSWA